MARKDKSRDAGGISEADSEYSKSYGYVPSKAESAVKAISSVLTMGMTDQMDKNREEKRRNEYVDEYNKRKGIEPEDRHKEYR